MTELEAAAEVVVAVVMEMEVKYLANFLLIKLLSFIETQKFLKLFKNYGFEFLTFYLVTVNP